MRLPNSAHTSGKWRIREVTSGFRLEDVWALPTPGGRGDFHRLVELVAALDPAEAPVPVVRALFDIRWKLGELFGWDGAAEGDTSRLPSLRDALPADLSDAPTGPSFRALPFTPLYLLDDEFAAEIANRTMHGVMHLAWVPSEAGGYEAGGYEAQVAVYVKPNGAFGAAYMAAIRPFRYLIYPMMLRQLGRRWDRAGAGIA